MKFKSIKSAAFVLTMCCFAANATLITYETRGLNEGIVTHDAKANFEAQTSVVNSVFPAEFSNIFSGRNTASYLSVEFSPNFDGIWNFEFGLDAAYGAAIYLNGAEIESSYSNIWWGYNWNKSLKSGDLAVSSGVNVLEVYWAENCCNGSNSAIFSSNSSGVMHAINVANIDAVNVAEPSSFAILALGLFAVGLHIRRNNNQGQVKINHLRN
jgi:hypothetical protein